MWSIQAFSVEGIEKLYIGAAMTMMSAASSSSMRASASAASCRSAALRLSAATSEAANVAALQLGISRSRLSETIRGLEDRLGVRLLNRTTRSVGPTSAGERLLARMRPLLDDFDAVLDGINAF